MSVQLSVVAAENLEPGRVVSLAGSYLDNSSTAPAGVTTAYSETGDVATILFGEIYLCDASGSIPQGAPVVAGTDGKIVDGTALSGSAAWFVGTAIKTASGNKVQVRVDPYFVPSPS